MHQSWLRKLCNNDSLALVTLAQISDEQNIFNWAVIHGQHKKTNLKSNCYGICNLGINDKLVFQCLALSVSKQKSRAVCLPLTWKLGV